MNITVARMGNLHIALSALFSKMGLRYIVPPPVTEKTYEIGFKLSPEQVCLPFKICMGNYVEAIERGADTIIMAGGNGPCRFGFYGVLQERILREAGYAARMLILNQDNVGEVFGELSRIVGKSRLALVPSFYFAWKALRLSEKNDELSAFYRARTTKKGEVTAVHKSVQERILSISTHAAASALSREIEHIYRSAVACDVPPEEVLQIGLLGEIYMVLDDRANMDVVRFLGDMNVWVRRTISISDWLLKLIYCDFFTGKSYGRMKRIARPYLSSDVGGKGVQTIASAIIFARQKVDGLVHITPFSCMPEIVATTILPKVCQDHGVPSLFLVFDEHTAPAAVVTRLEAFVDMLRLGRRK